MDKKQIKRMISDRLKHLEDQFAEELNNEGDRTMAEYLEVAQLEGRINSLVELLVAIDREK